MFIAPYSGLPFKTLAFIYDEQGDKEMALQVELSFLICSKELFSRDPSQMDLLYPFSTISYHLKISFIIIYQELFISSAILDCF